MITKMHCSAAIIRLVIAWVFFFAALAKLANPASSAWISEALFLDREHARLVTYGVVSLELLLGAFLLIPRTSSIAAAIAFVCLGTAAAVFLLRYYGGNLASCGCLGGLEALAWLEHPLVASARNLIMAAALSFVLWSPGKPSSMTRQQHGRRFGRAFSQRTAFTLAELLVVIGVIGLLLALLLPALNRARASSHAQACAATMRNIGHAAFSYASDYRGFVPRDHTPALPDRNPHWLLLLGPYVEDRGDWKHAWRSLQYGEQVLRELNAFKCPSHPLADEIHGCYVVNAFKFESAPDWDPDGPVNLAKVQNTSGVIYVAEVANVFTSETHAGNDIFRCPEMHDVSHPEHLPRQPQARMSDERHRDKANLLFFDGSVRPLDRGGLTLQMFDDGVTQRATRWIY
jgi:prepilin-type processing-associated H-X9-DG protein